MGLTTYGNYEIEDQVNFTVYVPKVEEHFIGSLTVIPLQLLGYYVSVAKGLDVDKLEIWRRVLLWNSYSMAIIIYMAKRM